MPLMDIVASMIPGGGIVKAGLEIFTKREERKQAKLDNEYKLLQQQGLTDSQIRLQQTKNAEKSWKDEYALLLITAPVLYAFGLLIFALIFGLSNERVDQELARFTQVIKIISMLPDWWQMLIVTGLCAALGIKMMKK